MNAQAFSELIKNTALLGKYSLWELQELAQEHPYSSVVYSLVALKAHQEGDGNYEHHLNQAALRIADRKKLFELIHADYEPVTAETFPQAAEQQLPLGDDFETITTEPPSVETQHVAPPSEEISQEKIPAQEIEKEEPAFAEAPQEFSPQEEAVEAAPEQHIEKTESITEEVESIAKEPESVTEEITPETQHPTPSIDLPGADEVLQALGGLKISKKEAEVEDVEEVSEAELKQPQKPAAQENDAHSFSEWLSLLTKGAQPQEPAMQEEVVAESLQPEPAAPDAVFQPEPADEATDEEKEIDEIIITKQAKASLSQDDELVTETLAKIYELQKKYEKAIKAYHTLSLKYPEKRAYFADKIEKLKNK